MTEYLLGELLVIKNGKDHKALNDGKIPVYGSGGLMRYVNKSIYDGESILLPRKGSLENIQYVNEPFWTVDTLYYSIVNSKKANTFYLFNYLKRLDLSKLNSGTGVPSMTFGAYYNVKVQLPDLSAQQKIASVLTALDDKIELNNKINIVLEAMAKTLYDYWFVQFDFPDADGKPYKSSGGEMVYNEVLKREIPKGWEEGLLEEMVQFNPSLQIKKNTNSQCLDMSSLPTNGYMTQSPILKPFSGGVKFQNGDLLVARITPCLENGKTALVTMLEKNTIGFGSTEFINMRAKNILSTSYLAILSRSELFRHYIISRMVGTSGRKRVEAKALSNYTLPIPPENLLESFAYTVDFFFEKMTSNQKQNQELVSLRDWLLPMLMNRQVRVSGADEEDEVFRQTQDEKLGMVGDEETK